jgi:hypothetical protein
VKPKSKRRGSHTHSKGSAVRHEQHELGRPKGIVSGGLLQSPTRSLRRSTTPALDWADGFDWYSFNCTTCADEVVVGRDLDQSLEDFRLMVSWLHGDPPICSYCLRPELFGL